LLPHSGAVGPFHGRRLGPLVDGSNRVDNFPDSGGASFACFLQVGDCGKINAI
jgi:hypothetical protein